MLDYYFSLESVNRLMYELINNPRYILKNAKDGIEYQNYVKDNLALYIFYDSIFKYKVIVDDHYLFQDYIDQVEKLYRKLNDFDDIMFGIHQLLCNMVSVLLDIKDPSSEEGKKAIISYIYQKYIVDGYYIHGFPTAYEGYIYEHGFDSGNYQNYYQDMMNLQKLFDKHQTSELLLKDFHDKTTYFTDDFVMGCYYSTMAPGFFSNLLLNDLVLKKASIDDYLIPNYSSCIEDLKRFMNLNLFSENDQNFVLRVVQNEWKYLNSVSKRVSLLFVPRKLFSTNSSLDSYEWDYKDVYNAADRILSPRNSTIPFHGNVSFSDIQLVSFYFPNQETKKRGDHSVEKVPKKEEVSHDSELLNASGVASFLIVCGSLFISFGIIISIFFVLRGI